MSLTVTPLQQSQLQSKLDYAFMAPLSMQKQLSVEDSLPTLSDTVTPNTSYTAITGAILR